MIAARRTPVIEVAELGVHLKLECLQRTGSFKLRGALRACAALAEDQRRRGVVVASAGNHGAGMALACRAAGIDLTVVVPPGTPATKQRRIRAEGAEIVVAGSDYNSAEAAAHELAAERGAAFVSAYDDEPVMEGNGGDLGRELAEQLPGLARVLVPVGGGGLIAGLARALEPRGVAVTGVQPERNCAMYRSLAAGRALTDYSGEATCAEGCAGGVGAAAFAVARDRIAGVELVSEAAIEEAVRYAYRRLGVASECSGAVALAACLSGGAAAAGEGVTAVVVTGGNIDDDELDRIVAGATRDTP